MADYLASIFGTEKDKVNCSFYYKIGACRHGERCSRLHNKPTFSQAILLQNLYQNPANVPPLPDGRPGCTLTEDELQQNFDNFFADMFWEMEEKYGDVVDMNVCDNLGDHLVGNVYIMFKNEEDAEKAVMDLNNRWYNGRPIIAELSPVTDFREACCRQYELGECTRGGFCNFMHLKPLSRTMRDILYGDRRREVSPGNMQFDDKPVGGRGGGGGGGGDRGGFGRRDSDRRPRSSHDHRGGGGFDQPRDRRYDRYSRYDRDDRGRSGYGRHRAPDQNDFEPSDFRD
eukprot:gene6864-7578_t